MGVVLNRPSAVTVADAVPQLEETVPGSDPVFVGGPVQPGAIVMVAEFEDPGDAGLLVVGRIGFPSSDADLAGLATSTSRGRVFAGYAGWGAEQLDAEISNGDWIAHAAVPDDVFTDEPEDLWSGVLTRKGGAYALIARMPLDPSVN
jgi:putative transcriptional regulator